MTFAGWIATLAGWYVTEIGRQPWLVYGVLRTADAATAKPIPIGISLTLYVTMYVALIVSYISVLFYMGAQGRRSAGAAFTPRENRMAPDLATPAGWLPVVFMTLMGVALLLYVVLDGYDPRCRQYCCPAAAMKSDGYDLGVGILLPGGSDEEKDMMVGAIGPFWDANETWLVLGIGILLVAFPMAHGVVLSSLYLPVVGMLIGLTLRGVAFDFRVKVHSSHKPLWNGLFWLGSLTTAVAQGWMLGSYITGFSTALSAQAFAALTALCVPLAYALLGAGWLLIKTTGALQAKAVHWARRAWWGALAGFLAVSVVSPLVSERIFHKWFDLPYVVLLLPLPIVTMALLLIAARALHRLPMRMAQGNDYGAWVPFGCTVGVIVLGFYGLAYSLFSLPRGGSHHHLAGGQRAGIADGDPHRRGRGAARHPRLHHLRVPRVPRQGAAAVLWLIGHRPVCAARITRGLQSASIRIYSRPASGPAWQQAGAKAGSDQPCVDPWPRWTDCPTMGARKALVAQLDRASAF